MVLAADIPVCTSAADTVGCATREESTRGSDDLEVTCDNAVELDFPLSVRTGPKGRHGTMRRKSQLGATSAASVGEIAIESLSAAVLNSIAAIREF